MSFSLLRTVNNLPLTVWARNQKRKAIERRTEKISFHYNGTYINRSKGQKRLCIVLAGYKEFLYDDVFGRIEKFSSDKIDYCIVSSGKYSEKLDEICRKNEWSYLSTKENNVNLVQNIAINNHPSAEYIYKLDEDIFIPEGYFDRLFEAYGHACESEYNPGVLAPLLLVNGFSSRLILEKINRLNEFETKFGKLKYEAGPDKEIEKNADAAKFMWGDGGHVPHLDILDKKLSEKPIYEVACPIRFSIGAIFFTKDYWQHMKYFDVSYRENWGLYSSMGKDEVKICSNCCLQSMPLMVSMNIVAGHFSFGKQTEEMKRFYFDHPDRFRIMEI